MTKKNFGLTIAATFVLLAQTALAGSSYSCQLKSNDGKKLIPITITPTGTRGGGGAYDIRTADMDLPEPAKTLAAAVAYENNPLNTRNNGFGSVFVMETKSTTDTATEFRVKFGFNYGFFSTQAEKSEIYINKTTGQGYYRANIREAFSLKHRKTDIEFSGCKPLEGNWYDPQTEAKLWEEADASAAKPAQGSDPATQPAPNSQGSQTQAK